VKLALSITLALVIACAASADQPETSCQALCGGDYLGPFFDKLEGVQRHHGQHPLNIIQIGDSHSASDNTAGAWRETLQHRYGHGGRGVMQPGVPFAGYHMRGVTVTQSPGWTTQSVFDAAFRDGAEHALFGISGFRQTAHEPGAKMTLSADTPEFEFDRLVICAVNGPEAGSYDLQFNGETQHVDLHAEQTHVACVSFQAATPQIQAELEVVSGPVTMTSWANYRDEGGVTVSNLGVVGAQVKNWLETDEETDAAEMAAYAPDLIVLEFGTNDAFVGRFDPYGYEAALKATIRRLRRVAPNVPILMLGAPDAATNRAELAANAPTDQPPSPPGVWYPPPGLAAVRAVQLRVAREMDVAFWNWSARMGGPFTADRWANADPPMMRKDRVHYTVVGGARVAALLESDFEAAKAAYILDR
jgi:hypothetical protein